MSYAYRKAYIPCAVLFYILVSLSNNPEALKIDHKITTEKRKQPLFHYTKHIVELKFFDHEYSTKNDTFIPGSGVIISSRILMTAAHLFKRGTVKEIHAFHKNCGGVIDVHFSHADAHWKYKGKPPLYDIGLIMVNNTDGITGKCPALKIARLPSKAIAFYYGQRAVLVGYEYFYEHFIFSTRRTTTTPTPTTTPLDPRYYSSEYYSSEVEEQPCCSTPRIMRLLRRKQTEAVIKIQQCPHGISGDFYCSYEQNKTIPYEGDMGTALIDQFGVVIGILSFQKFVTYDTTINYYVDVAAVIKWVQSKKAEMLTWT